MDKNNFRNRVLLFFPPSCFLLSSSDSHPRSWKNTLTRGDASSGGGGAPAPAARKRFSMNYLDTIGDADPRSWRNTIVGRVSGGGGGGGQEIRRRAGADQQELQAKRSRWHSPAPPPPPAPLSDLVRRRLSDGPALSFLGFGMGPIGRERNLVLRRRQLREDDGEDDAEEKEEGEERNLDLLRAIDKLVARVAGNFGRRAVCNNKTISRLEREGGGKKNEYSLSLFEVSQITCSRGEGGVMII